MDIADLKTPCAVVDLDRLERNARRMADRAHRLGVLLRPHVKTHKCLEVAHLQIRDQFGGITVSTLAEAQGFAAGGFDDITWALPLPLDRLDDCVELHHVITRFHLLVDHPQTAAELDRCAAAHGIRFSVFLKVDCGHHRAGVEPESDAALALASTLHRSPNLEFAGLLTHAGHSYQCRSRAEVVEVAQHERDVVLRFAHRLREQNIAAPIVSIGSTPTAAAVDHLAGITEIRPGNYIFCDAFQAAIGSCGLDDLALSVMGRVISRSDERNQVVVNAGSLALSRDPGPTHVDADCGFGVVVSPAAQRSIPGLTLAAISQEHGVIHSPRPLHTALQPGAPVRILPNHACLTAACFDRYFVARGTEVVDEWQTLRGW